ncbi:MAG: beta-hydroxyacyl-ACP dehydratase [Gemmataceae bacterium]|nr:beta-hydroxyacyl-ACP dehydratase [Gemmataceae bacterium]
MRFNLIDHIADFQAGKSLTAVKNLTLGEEYLADHFPTFPVMPGVLMLETLVEAGAWLLRLTHGYRHSVFVLREARNVKYGTFMAPGNQMKIHVELLEETGETAVFKGRGETQGQSTVSAKITLGFYNLGDKDPGWKETDRRIIEHYRDLHRQLIWVPAGSPAQVS